MILIIRKFLDELNRIGGILRVIDLDSLKYYYNERQKKEYKVFESKEIDSLKTKCRKMFF